MSTSQQGSASYTLVIGVMAALIVGAIVLTMMFYPIMDAFMDSAFFDSNTIAGDRVTTYVGGVWVFWGAILLIGMLSWVWVRTRQ